MSNLLNVWTCEEQEETIEAIYGAMREQKYQEAVHFLFDRCLDRWENAMPAARMAKHLIETLEEGIAFKSVLISTLQDKFECMNCNLFYINHSILQKIILYIFKRYHTCSYY